MSHSAQQPDETKFSSGVSHITVPDELNKMVQYLEINLLSPRHPLIQKKSMCIEGGGTTISELKQDKINLIFIIPVVHTGHNRRLVLWADALHSSTKLTYLLCNIYIYINK